jgi:SAM-dependent methyltransferase
MSPAAPWITRFGPRVTPQGAVLDLACGGGRHGRWFMQRGHPVTLVDRDLSGVLDLQSQATLIEADLEAQPWPLDHQTFAAVVVSNYLWRPLLPQIVAAVAPGGWLLYQTFAVGNERFGRPRNPDFLLQPGELLRACAGLKIIAYEDDEVQSPRPAMIQRIAAHRP